MVIPKAKSPPRQAEVGGGTLLELQAAAQKLELEARKRALKSRTKTMTQSISATMSAAIDVDGLFAREIVQSMMQVRGLGLWGASTEQMVQGMWQVC